MAAWLGPALQLGSTALGGIFGMRGADQAAEEASRVAEINERIARRNLEFQKVAREEGMEVALQLLEEGRLGQTDAQGNRVYFDPERGWVTELSPMQQQISDRLQDEQLRRATDSTARAASAEERMSRIGRTSEDMFSEAVQGIRGASPDDGGELARLLRRRAMGANNEVADAAQSSVMRRLTSTGSLSPGRLRSVMAGRAAGDAKNAATAALEAEINAKEYNDAKFNQDINRNAALARQFGNSAVAAPNTNPNLTNVSGPQGARGSDTVFGQQLISAARMAPQQDYISPNYGPSNATMDVGNMLQSGVGTLAGWFNNQNTMNQIRDIFGNNGAR